MGWAEKTQITPVKSFEPLIINSNAQRIFFVFQL